MLDEQMFGLYNGIKGKGGKMMKLKYVTCQKCGRRLFKGEIGTQIEMDCPTCGGFISVVIKTEQLSVSDRPLKMQNKPP